MLKLDTKNKMISIRFGIILSPIEGAIQTHQQDQILAIFLTYLKK